MSIPPGGPSQPPAPSTPPANWDTDFDAILDQLEADVEALGAIPMDVDSDNEAEAVDVAEAVALEVLDEAPVPTMTLEEAVIKMQAIVRGNQGRAEASERREAVIKVQAFARGVLARKKYGHYREIARYKSFVKDQLSYYYRMILGAQEQVEDNYRDRTLSDRRRETRIKEVQGVLKELQEIRDEVVRGFADPDALDLEDLRSNFSEQLRDLDHSVYRLALFTGTRNLEALLSLRIGEEWAEDYPREAHQIFSEFDGLFRPICATVVATEEVGDGTVRLRSQHDLKTSILDHSGNLPKRLPVVIKTTFQEDISNIEKLDSAEIVIPLPNGKALVVKGRFTNDAAHAAVAGGWFGEKLDRLEEAMRSARQPTSFKRRYLQTMRLADIATIEPADLPRQLKASYDQLQRYLKTNPILLIQEFLEGEYQEMVEKVRLLLLDEEDGAKRAIMLTKMMKTQIPLLEEIFEQTLPYEAQKMLNISRASIEQALKEREAFDPSDMSYSERIDLLRANGMVDADTLEKLQEKADMADGDGSDAGKADTWIKRALKIPFGTYVEDTAASDAEREQKLQCLADVRGKLDEAVFGHDEAKDMLEEVVAQWIQNKGSNGAVIALQGPPGNGKTTLAREGIAKALGRPFVSMAFGGATDGTILKGHSETYVGSKPGRIAELIMEAGCMNPVIYIDELDKISKTAKGDEIVGILTHLLDPSQNSDFHDDYFAGLKIDLSKALFVLSYNDDNKIEGIMGDRLTVIHTHGLRVEDKVPITHRYMMPGILKEVGFEPGEVTISDEVVAFIVNGYTFEAGARKLKEKLFKIVRRLNVDRLRDVSLTVPIEITEEMVRKVLGRPREMELPVPKRSKVGQATTLFYTAAGIGSISPLQVEFKPQNGWGGSALTGDVAEDLMEHRELHIMESAALQAIERMSPDLLERIQEERGGRIAFDIGRSSAGDQDMQGGHIGAAITVGMISKLLGMKLNRLVAVTGGMDVSGRVTKTDGLDMMLAGARRAGCKAVLVPAANKEELRDLRDEQPELFAPGLKVIPVRTIDDVMRYTLKAGEFVREKKKEAAESMFRRKRSDRDDMRPSRRGHGTRRR